MAESIGIHHAVKVYGTDWCEDTSRTRAHLVMIGVPFNYYNVDLDAGMKRTAMSLQGGGEKSPVVDTGDGTVLVEPSDDELDAALRASGHIK